MEILARSYVYWPGINENNEDLVLSCAPCQIIQNVPKAKDFVNWNTENRDWERVHIDFLDFEHYKILIIVDAYSKWVDAYVTWDTDCNKTIEKLLIAFNLLGFPEELCSDNGPPFNAGFLSSFVWRIV